MSSTLIVTKILSFSRLSQLHLFSLCLSAQQRKVGCCYYIYFCLSFYRPYSYSLLLNKQLLENLKGT